MLGMWIVALLGAFLLAPAVFLDRMDGTARLLAGWLWQARWTWSLVGAATIAMLSSPRAHRRWPHRTHRVQLGLALAVALIGLIGLTIARPREGLVALGAAVLIGLLGTWVLVVPRRLAPHPPAAVLDRLSDRERLDLTDARLKLRNDLRTTALQAIAGLAVLVGAVVAFQQLTEDRQQAAADRDLTRQGQASERFTRAIDQLGSDRREVQLGGIYGLEQIAQQAPDNRLAVREVLVAYVHRRAPRPTKPTIRQPEELRVRAPDVQAVLTVLGRRQAALTGPFDPPLDLRALDLHGADLAGHGFGFFNGPDFSLADLSGTDLKKAHLSRMRLAAADLRGADLRGADLSGTDLRGADFRGADLSGTDLSFAFLRAVNLRGTDLSGADLRGADFSSGRDLSRATADQHTRWPPGFDWHGAAIELTRSGTNP